MGKKKIPADIRKLAEVLDSKYKGPFGFRFGLDGILGLIPGVGDIITTALSVFILMRAALMEVPLPVLLRMLLNIFIDNMIAFVPVLGVLYDFIFKSNNRNIRLLEDYLDKPMPTKNKSNFELFLVASVVFLMFTSMLIGVIWLFDTALTFFIELIRRQ